MLSEHLSEKVREANSETSGEPLAHGAHSGSKESTLFQP